MTTQVVERPQHMVALDRANQIRLERAALKKRIAEGETKLPEVLLGVPYYAKTMTVYNLLKSQRRWGRTRVKKLLAEVPIHENKTLGSLTNRQRQAIIKLLER